MPLTHRGYTFKQIANAIGAVIQEADPNARVTPRWTPEFKRDEEEQDASTDEHTGSINFWYVLPGNRRVASDAQTCEPPKRAANRSKTDTYFLFFFYSYSEEIDSNDKISDDHFFDRLEAVANQFSVIPRLDLSPQKAVHSELQIDKIDVIPFRREDCHAATCRLQITYNDYVEWSE